MSRRRAQAYLCAPRVGIFQIYNPGLVQTWCSRTRRLGRCASKDEEITCPACLESLASAAAKMLAADAHRGR